MTQQVNFAVAPRLWRLVAFWAMFQIILIVVVLARSGSLQKALPIIGIFSGILLVACALGGAIYYRSLCKLRERGVVIEGEVVPGYRRNIYWVKYSYDGVEYKLRVGMVVDFDSSVRKILERGVSEKCPIRLLIDSAKPTRYFILPFEPSESQEANPPDEAK